MYLLGIDVGSVSTDFALLDSDLNMVEQLYLKTGGNPIEAVATGMGSLASRLPTEQIYAVGVTGSGRKLIGALVGADTVKNEITAHAAAAAGEDPDIRTVIEIGGQDSKLILLENGLVSDFAMNTVCAAGTGSFLDRQAGRLGMDISEMGDAANKSSHPADIAGRCAVFAETDLIHKQQAGCCTEDLLAGLCRALVRGYMSNVAKNKKLLPKVCFQGGVACNAGIRKAFEQEIGSEIYVPENNRIMGAIGIARLAGEEMESTRLKSKHTAFRGFNIDYSNVHTNNLMCNRCTNHCSVLGMSIPGCEPSYIGSRCGRNDGFFVEATGEAPVAGEALQ